ncbi:hypothetical protein D3C74_460690 [compost metagenome]
MIEAVAQRQILWKLVNLSIGYISDFFFNFINIELVIVQYDQQLFIGMCLALIVVYHHVDIFETVGAHDG